jgi:pyridoxal biosynthesis lyase PdxS
MECKCYITDTIARLDALLEKIENAAEHRSGDFEASLRHVLTVQEELKRLQKRHEELLYEQGRQYGENVKLFAIQAPPDKPTLKTVPWELGNPSTVIPPKGALTRRTAEAIPTVQKSQKKNSNKK